MLNDSTRKQYLTQNGYSRSFKVICFDVTEKPLGDYILTRNNFGLIYEVRKDIATTRIRGLLGAVPQPTGPVTRSLVINYRT